MEQQPASIKRILDEPTLIKILEVLLDGICAKDIETKHTSLLKIMKLLDLNIKKPIEFVSFEVGGQTYDLTGMDASSVLASKLCGGSFPRKRCALMQQIDENYSSQNL